MTDSPWAIGQALRIPHMGMRFHFLSALAIPLLATSRRGLGRIVAPEIGAPTDYLSESAVQGMSGGLQSDRATEPDSWLGWRVGRLWGLFFVCCLYSVDVMQNCEGSLSRDKCLF
jgi:hypothetical protein